MNNEEIICTPAPICAGCGAAGQIAHADMRDVLFGAPGQWSIRHCGCGLAWVDPQPQADDIPKLYASYYTHEQGEDASYQSTGAKALVKRILAMLLPWKRSIFQTDLLHLQGMKPGRLLEVGCGSGGFLAAASRAGWQSFGLDFDEKAIASARRIAGVDAAVGDIFDQNFEGGSFDAIVMNNVIEHLPEPSRVFSECHRLLAKGGRLVMITPNIDALGHEVFGRHWRGLEIPRHLFIYNRETLKTFAGKAGFRKITAFSSIGSSMHQASAELAAKAGAKIQTDVTNLRRRTMLLNLFGQSRGEWVVLVTEK